MFKLFVLFAVVLVAVNAAEYGHQNYGQQNYGQQGYGQQGYGEHKEATSFQSFNLKNSEHVEYVKVPVVQKQEYHHQPQKSYSSGHY